MCREERKLIDFIADRHVVLKGKIKESLVAVKDENFSITISTGEKLQYDLFLNTFFFTNKNLLKFKFNYLASILLRKTL